ncbi:MAG: B12-binding domain-containing radical SAM protein [Dehalococcoidia bacterium]|nr:Hopanoid C-2 methylase [Chloroflexota bacterium]MBT9162993.1 Hopanoid C-2 methylase [Chloroflexota bacterium]
MKILLVYPQYPDTFWSFKHILKFVSKKAAYPPLGLLTVAAMLPEEWEKRLVDMNIFPLKDKDIEWADYIFISAMITQKDSVKGVVERCNKLNARVVAGGPLFTTGYEEFEGIDHFVLGEAEVTLPLFLEDITNGCPKRMYVSDKRPDLTITPVPMWDLLNLRHYATPPIQYSRGCPYDCEFCDIIIMNGRVPRTKETSQLLREFDALYERGWRSSVFIVDDNFIGNKKRVKEMLPQVIAWQKERGYPFTFFTEASLNLAADDELLQLMIEAGFNKVFIGLETPSEASLAECNKFLNQTGDMVGAVKKIQNYGMQVFGGFIVGFDNDPPSIFESQINFIQRMGVVTAMVGILSVLPKTRLYNRLKEEGRLLKASSGDNTDGSLNFVPKMDAATLIKGYQKIMQTIYSPKKYYERIITFLEEYKPVRRRRRVSLTLTLTSLKSFLKSVWYLGIVGESRRYYWKLVINALLKYRRAFPEAITMAIYGLHFRKVTEKLLK